MHAAGYALVNVVRVLSGKEPRIAPLRGEMRATIGRPGFTGRGDGLAAEAVALPERR